MIIVLVSIVLAGGVLALWKIARLQRDLRDLTAAHGRREPSRPPSVAPSPLPAVALPEIAAPTAPAALVSSTPGHAWRTSLNIILGFAEVMRREDVTGALTSRQSQALDQIQAAGQRLLGLVETDIDTPLSWLDEDAGPVEALDAVRAARHLRLTFKSHAEARGVVLTPPVGPLGVVVAADRIRLRHILQAMTAHVVSTCRSGAEVTTDVRQMRDFVEIALAVNQPRNPARIAGDTAVFSDGRAGRIGEVGGIGLAGARRLALALGGRIEARPDRLVLMLPPAGGATLPGGEAPAVQSRSRPRAFGARRPVILYVEDNPSNIILMRRVMASLGDFDLFVGETGHQGLAMARDIRPDVVMLDIDLPGLSGLEVKAQLDRDPATRDLAVLALSANASADDLRRGRDAGFLDYLTKPFDIDDLATALNRALGEVHARPRRVSPPDVRPTARTGVQAKVRAGVV